MTPSTPTTSSASSPRSPLPPAPQRSLKAGFVHRQFGIWPKPSLSLVRRGGEEDEEELLPRSTLPLPPDTVGWYPRSAPMPWISVCRMLRARSRASPSTRPGTYLIISPPMIWIFIVRTQY